MSWEQIFIMRHELVLVSIILLLLFAEIGLAKDKKSVLISWGIVLMLLATLIGFVPIQTGKLFGGMYVSDPFRVMLKNILNLGTLLIFLQSSEWLRNEENKDRISEFFLLMLSSLIGINYLISAGGFLMLHLSLELTTIPVAALAAYEQIKHKSAEAGIKMILSSAFSSGILLFGISLLYGSTGSLLFDNIFILNTDPLQMLGLIFFFTGLAFKISVVPFHLWTADVYEGSPVGVTSYLSVISKGGAVFILLILLINLFGTLKGMWVDLIYISAVLTMTIGNLFAIRQKNLKRFLAFSSIAQAGFILLGVIGGSALGTAAVVYFILIYIFSNLGAFGVIATIAAATGKEEMNDYNGLYKTNPRLSLVMMLSLFSLAGIPPVAGFFGKFFLFTAAAEQGYYWLVFIAVINAIISLYYYLLVIKAMFINKNEHPLPGIESGLYARIGLVICSLGMIFVGFLSSIFEYIYNLSKNL